MSTDSPFLHIVEDGVAVVTLNRPAAMNSINKAMRMGLMELFPALDQRRDVKVIVLTGAGDKAFCTGADLKERANRSSEEIIDERQHIGAAWASVIGGVSKPVIAAIKGYCMGGGYEMALQCDIVLAAESAIFCLPEVTHGFFPGAGACQRLPRLVGLQMAKELILTGRRWDVQEAKSLGLVNRVLPLDRLMDETMAMARKMASYPAVGVVQAKRAINQSVEVGLNAGLRFDIEAWIGCMHSDEWKAKLDGFVNKERKS